MTEARLCLRKLAVPFFHHEVVKQALLRMMEVDEAKEQSLVQLLKQLSSTGEVSESQMARVSSSVLTLFQACLLLFKLTYSFSSLLTCPHAASPVPKLGHQSP